MAKEPKKRGEKLGEVVGRRRPIIGSVFIFVAFILMVSAFSYAPSQNIFFRSYLESFLPTTEIYGENLCGAFGATFTLLAIISLGAAAYTIPVYIFWLGVLLWQRRARGISKLEFVCAVGGILLFSILCAILQGGVETSGEQSAFWPLGWGGKFGTVVFDNALKPFLDIFGSLALVGILFLFCVIVVFVDSPVEAAKELAGAAKKSPSVFLRVAKIIFKAIAFLPSVLFGRRRESAGESEEKILSQSMAARRNVAEVSRAPVPAQRVEPVEIAAPPQADRNAFSRPDIPKATRADAAVAAGVADAVLEGTGLETARSETSKIQGDRKTVNFPISDFTSRFDSDEEDMDFIPSRQPDSDGGVEEPSFEEPEAQTPEPDEPVAADEPRQGDIDLRNVKPLEPKKTSKHESLKVEEFKAEKYVAKLPTKTRDGYVFPSVDLLDKPKEEQNVERENYEERMAEIVAKIADFGIAVNPVKASSGPVITRYEVRPDTGVRLNRIASLEDDIALGIRAEKVRIIAPIPGHGTVGIEIPNKIRGIVRVRDIIESREWNESRAEIPVALGKDITGVPIVLDLAKMPHALIAGSTGSGKSVCINSIILSLLYKMTPDDLRFIMVDPKVVEMQIYNSLPHMLIPVVTDPKKVPAALKWLTSEMMRRYRIFKESGVRNIAGFNAKILKDAQSEQIAEASDAAMTPEERTALVDSEEEASESGGDSGVEIPKKKLPYIVCIIDELADLMMVAGKEVEGSIARLTQLARAAGIHLIVATQRPSRDVITGLIKNNLPTRIAFKVTSQIDSRTILDHKGAETLIGYGDMLYINNGSADMVRAQGAFMSDEEIARVVDALKVNGEPEYAEEVQQEIDSAGEEEEDSGGGDDSGDAMFSKAVAVVKANKKASTSLLQRKLGIGYGRAARIIDEMEDRGMIGPDNGPGTQREIYI